MYAVLFLGRAAHRVNERIATRENGPRSSHHEILPGVIQGLGWIMLSNLFLTKFTWDGANSAIAPVGDLFQFYFFMGFLSSLHAQDQILTESTQKNVTSSQVCSMGFSNQEE